MKKIVSAILAVMMLISVSGCSSSDTSWIAKSGDITVPVGAYMYYGLNNYFMAMEKVDASKAFSKETQIDGVSTSEWIRNESLKNVKSAIAVRNKCKELGVEISEDDKASLSKSTASFYKQMESTIFAPNGISESSILFTTEDVYLRDMLFKKYYDVGGIEEISQAEVEQCAKDERARVKWIEIQLKDGNGNLLKSEGKAEMKKMAEDYIRRYNAGEDFDALIAEHEEYYKKLIADATGEEAKSEFEDEEVEKEYPNEVIISKNGTVPTEALNKEIFEKAKIGTPILLEGDETYYVVLRFDITERKDYMEENRTTFLYSLKDDEFDAMINKWAEEADITVNEDSVRKYKPEKFDLTGLNG